MNYLDIAESIVMIDGEPMTLIEFIEANEFTSLQTLMLVTALFARGFCDVDTGNFTTSHVHLKKIASPDDRVGVDVPTLI
jgi:hypothetical protein